MKKEISRNVLLIVFGLMILSVSQSTIAGDKYAKAWVWANNSNSAINSEYTPSANYQNVYGFERILSYPYRIHMSGQATVKRLGTGQYQVKFENLNMVGGTVHITAYGGNHQCKVKNWYPSNGNQLVNVNCFNTAGVPANGKFTALYYKNSIKGDYYTDGYVWANEPTSTDYTPNETYQENSSDTLNTIHRYNTGYYKVTMPNMKDVDWLEEENGGTVMVTAYGSSSDHCKVQYWYMFGHDLNAYVRCFDSSGSPVDSKYTMSFLKNSGTIGLSVAEDTLQGAFAWITSTGYAPNYYQQNYGDEISAERIDTGFYRVNIPDLNHIHSTAKVTAYGGGNGHCNINNWYQSTDGTNAYVKCYDSNGTQMNSAFTLQYFTSDIILY